MKFIKLIVSVLFLLFLFSRLNFKEVFFILKDVNLAFYFLVVVIFFFNQAISSLKWKIILNNQRIKISFLNLYKYYLFGTVSNLFLPTGIGGDIVKTITLIKKEKINKKESVCFATISDRLSGVFSIFILVFFSLIINFDLFQQLGISYVSIYSFCLLLMIFLFLFFLFIF